MTERGSDPTRFDPRFDPAFQPGYDPRNDPTSAARAASRFADQQAPDFEGAPAEKAVPTAAHRAPPAVAPRNNSERDSGRRRDSFEIDRDLAEPSTDNRQNDAQDDAQDDGTMTDDAAPSYGVNPFLLALWALSALFIVGGIALLRAIPGLEQDLATGSSADGGVSFYIIFSLASAAPVLMGLGLATATGTLFLHAARWRR